MRCSPMEFSKTNVSTPIFIKTCLPRDKFEKLRIFLRYYITISLSHSENRDKSVNKNI